MQRSSRSFLWLYVVPALGLVVLVVLPLMRGTETLYLRDVLQAHLPMKAAQAEAWRAGYVPEIDPYRAGGQPSAGNPNAVPFYPTNLLYLVASPFRALNAHFWIHWLLAPLAGYWLGRAWGLPREGAWATGVAYGFSGYFLSHLSFYNLIAGATLTPALVAACLEARAGRRRGAPLAGLLWALLVVAGDPFIALLAFVIAATAVVAAAGTVAPGRLLRRVPLAPLAWAFAAGTLLAAPQWMEFLRILPLSFRGHFGFGGDAGAIQSFDPRQTLEWLVPLAFGRPDRLQLGSFWGHELYTGFPPYFFSLFSGLLVLALVAVSGWPGGRRTGDDGDPPLAPRARAWAWLVAGGGVFFALGGFNPAARWLFAEGSLRYPVKFWLAVAVPLALLAGLGFERVFRPGRPARWRPLARALGLLALVYLALLAWLLGPGAAGLRRLIPRRHGDGFVTNEALRWGGLALFSLLLILATALVLALLRRRPRVAGAALLALHAATQLAFLAPLRATDAALPYRVPPPLLARVPADALVVHGNFLGLFGDGSLSTAGLPGPETSWYIRRTFQELYPATAPLWQRRYQMNVSPEGLDSFLTEMARSAVEIRGDEERLRLLRAWGVSVLLLGRPVLEDAPDATRDALRQELLIDSRLQPSLGGGIWVHRLRDPAPEITFAPRLLPAPHLNAAMEILTTHGFDPATMVVIPGEEEALAPFPTPARRSAAAELPTAELPTTDVATADVPTAELLTRGPESFSAAVATPVPGVLVVQRSHLALWRARVEGSDDPSLVGRELEVIPANVHRLGVELPAGRHRVRLWVDRTPLAWATALAVAGLALLLALGVRQRHRQGVPLPPPFPSNRPAGEEAR